MRHILHIEHIQFEPILKQTESLRYCTFLGLSNSVNHIHIDEAYFPLNASNQIQIGFFEGIRLDYWLFESIISGGDVVFQSHWQICKSIENEIESEIATFKTGTKKPKSFRHFSKWSFVVVNDIKA